MIVRRILVVAFVLVAVASISLVYAPPADTRPPTIGMPVIQPASPGPGDTVTVMVNVTDDRSGVKNVTIVYTTDNWQSANSSITAAYNATTGLATAQIPSPFGGAHVAYYIVAFDNDGNRAINDNNGSYFAYDSPGSPGPVSITTITYIGVLAAVGAAIALMAYMLLKKPSSAGTSQVSTRTGEGQY